MDKHDLTMLVYLVMLCCLLFILGFGIGYEQGTDRGEYFHMVEQVKYGLYQYNSTTGKLEQAEKLKQMIKEADRNGSSK